MTGTPHSHQPSRLRRAVLPGVAALVLSTSVWAGGVGAQAASTPSPGPWTAIAGDLYTVCAIRTDGTLWCWGDALAGTKPQEWFPTQQGTAANWTSIAVGTDTQPQWCGIKKTGALWCGSIGGTPRQIAPGTSWESVAVSGIHTCGIQTGGSLWCWGQNGYGQLGLGDKISRGAPTRVGKAHWSDVTVHAIGPQAHTCAVRIDHTLWCWGSNDKGQLGLGDRRIRLRPSEVATPHQWLTASAGVAYTCGVALSGTLWCWGRNDSGQLGLGYYEKAPKTPHQVGTGHQWTSLTTSYMHTCGLKSDGSLWCWGYNEGDLGNRTWQATDVPSRVVGHRTWIAAVALEGDSCAVDSTGAARCFGQNAQGELGNGTVVPRNVPVPVVKRTRAAGPRAGWKSIASGAEVHCALGTAGRLSCWGENRQSQFGSGWSQETVVYPVPATDGHRWLQVAMGGWFSCGIDLTHHLWCWGFNTHGQLGDGTTEGRAEPVEIDPQALWSSVAFGDEFACATQQDGTLWCWGDNYYGELGDGGYEDEHTPHQVGTESDWASVSAGSSHACAIKTDDSLWCWGNNSAGQLGLGTTESVNVPTQVGEEQWSNVSAGYAATCAVMDDQTLWCWGWNSHGQLGDGGTDNQPSPTQVGTDADWLTVTTASTHSCGITNAGSLWCWGDNADGQLGDGTTTERHSPVAVHTKQSFVSVSGSVTTLDDSTCGLTVAGGLYCFGAETYGLMGDGTQSYVGQGGSQPLPRSVRWP